ncbi:hypothetical protein NKI12_00560 [Mesorhizobium australicum]|uniref:Uncharacterized protein n=1 Tax=Mesorhizobium australicum TaxID=536018 RepID=A0ACC6SZZ9_9HYPH
MRTSRITASVRQLKPISSNSAAVVGAQIQTAGASLLTLASKNRGGVEFSG